MTGKNVRIKSTLHCREFTTLDLVLMGLLPVEQQPMNFVSTSTTDLPIRNVMVSNQPCLFLADNLKSIGAAILLFFNFQRV